MRFGGNRSACHGWEFRRDGQDLERIGWLHGCDTAGREQQFDCHVRRCQEPRGRRWKRQNVPRVGHSNTAHGSSIGRTHRQDHVCQIVGRGARNRYRFEGSSDQSLGHFETNLSTDDQHCSEFDRQFRRRRQRYVYLGVRPYECKSSILGHSNRREECRNREYVNFAD